MKKRWHLARDSSKILSSEYFDTYFAYYQVLNGVDEAPSASKMYSFLPFSPSSLQSLCTQGIKQYRCTGAVNSLLGMLVGRYFIQETWSEASQDISEHLIGTIKQAFHSNLMNITWLVPFYSSLFSLLPLPFFLFPVLHTPLDIYPWSTSLFSV